MFAALPRGMSTGAALLLLFLPGGLAIDNGVGVTPP